MAGQLPAISGKEVCEAFENGGWQFGKQSGSHMIMVKVASMATLSIPNHKTVARGSLYGA